MTQTKKLIFLGEPLEEFRADGSRSIAGDAVNFAVGTARMNASLKQALGSDAQIEVHVMGAIGDDERSKTIRQYLKANNVVTDHLCAVHGGHAGAYDIQLDAHGERDFIYKDREDAAFRKLFDAEGPGADCMADALSVMRPGTTLVLSGITISRLRNTADFDRLLAYVKLAKEEGARIVVDANYRAKLWPGEKTARERITPFLHLADTIYISRPDDTKLWLGEKAIHEIVGNTFAHGGRNVVVKQGEKGSVLYWRDPKSRTLQSEAIPSHKVKVVDTTGAGDTLMAAAELALAHGADMEHAQMIGARAAAQIVQQNGGVLDEANVPTVAQWQQETRVEKKGMGR